MGKLRNADTDVGKFTQWLGRKCRNHNPLSELGLGKSDRAKLSDRYKAPGKGDLAIVADGTESTLLYRAAGRAFKIEVTEIEDPAQLDQYEKIAVGF